MLPVEIISGKTFLNTSRGTDNITDYTPRMLEQRLRDLCAIYDKKTRPSVKKLQANYEQRMAVIGLLKEKGFTESANCHNCFLPRFVNAEGKCGECA